MRNLTLPAFVAAATLLLAACQEKPIEPMKPRVAVAHIQEWPMGIQFQLYS